MKKYDTELSLSLYENAVYLSHRIASITETKSSSTKKESSSKLLLQEKSSKAPEKSQNQMK